MGSESKTEAMKSRHKKVLKGYLTDLPSEESTTVRVVFSSTYSDMKVERTLLMKESVPLLRDYCKERRLDFQAVDMRWGVLEQASVAHETTDLCLQEVINSQQQSAGPYFVAFLGDRYGTRLLPLTIPVAEYRSLRRLASWMDCEDFAAVDKWYLVDTNAVPALYAIQPIVALCPHYHDTDPKKRMVMQQHKQTWERDRSKMMNAFHVVCAEATRRKLITEEEHSKYYISVTHREVKQGLINSPDASSRNVNKVLCFHRTLDSIKIEDSIAKRFADLTEEGEIDMEARDLLDRLKTDVVPEHLHEGCISTHAIPWTEYGVYFENLDHEAYLKTMCDTFTAKMMAMIDVCADKRGRPLTPDQERYREIVAHLRIAKEKSRVFFGREDELGRIIAFLERVYTTAKDDSNNAKKDDVKENGISGNDDGVAATGEKHKGGEEAGTARADEAAAEQIPQNEETGEEAGGGKGVTQPLGGGGGGGMQALIDMCKLTGATFCYGDNFDDDESDPTRDPKEEQATLPPVMDKFKRPLVIHGPAGSGKTALMARVVQMSKSWRPGSVCVARFMGTTPASSDIRSVLVSVCGQLHDVFAAELSPPPAGLVELSVDFQYLVAYFAALLWRVGGLKGATLFLVLDSVDQLVPGDYSHLLHWLPAALPANVHLFVSLDTEHSLCLQSAKELFPRDEQFIQVGSLDSSTAEKILRSACHKAGRTLTAAQRNLVLRSFADSGQALHLRLLTERALSWRSWAKVSQLQLADSLEAAMDQLFAELEKNHGEVFVAHTLCYLSLSKHGLSDTELEDILSLDDEVLQDTFIDHLPPDPSVIRFPLALWLRLKSDLGSYLVQHRAGNSQVNAWYHRHFREAALSRYCTEENDLEWMLCDALSGYYLGRWSSRTKPLELTKGLPGSYEECLRGVPALPLKYQGSPKVVYNVRKFQELPAFLARSDKWNDFHGTVACSVEWLVGVSASLGVTQLLAHFAAMMARPRPPPEDEVKQQKVKDIALVQAVLKLGVDEIRRDATAIPLQILGQLGPCYKGSAAIEDLVRQCQAFAAESDVSMLVPGNAFMPAPGNLMQSCRAMGLSTEGSDRACSRGVCLDADKGCLYAVDRQLHGAHDTLQVLDQDNAGQVVTQFKLPYFIHSVQLVSPRRFFILKTYSKLSKNRPEFCYVMYEGGFTAPYIFKKPVTAMAASSHGKLIAFSYQDDRAVNMGPADAKTLKVQVKHHMYMDHPVAAVLFSPDASELVGIDVHGNISTYNTAKRQALSLITNTNKLMLATTRPTAEQFQITRSNLLLRVAPQGLDATSLSVLDLATRQEKHRLVSEELKYDFDIVQLDEREEFVAVCTTKTTVVSGNLNKPALVWRLSSGELSCVLESEEAWQALRLLGRQDALFCVAARSQRGVITVLHCGTRAEPDMEPEVMIQLHDHSDCVLSLTPIQDNTVLVSTSMDNTLRFWDLGRILRERSVKEEDLTQLMGSKMHLKKQPENKSEVELRGKTTAVVVTGMETRRAFFGTDEGVVGFCGLDDSGDRSVHVMEEDLPPVHLMILSRKGEYLLVAALNTVSVFDTKQGELLYEVMGLPGQKTISCLAEGGYTAALGHGGMEGKVKLWDLKTGVVIKEMTFLYSFTCTAVNRSGTQVVAAMFEYPLVIDIYATEKDQMAGNNNVRLDRLDTTMTTMTFMCVSPDDRLVAACANNGSTRVVSTENKYLHRLQQKSSPTFAVFSADSQLLLTSGYRSVYAWSMGDGKLAFKLSRHADFVTCMRWALDERFLLTASLDRSVALWDVQRRVTVCALPAHCPLSSVHLLPDLSSLVYAPDRSATLALLAPNPALRRVLEKGSSLKDVVNDSADPETLEQASSFATVFNTQKKTSAACNIL